MFSIKYNGDSMLDITLLKNILIVSIASSIISTSLVQLIKEATNSKKYIFLINLFISMTTGVLFTLTFTDLNIINSLWVGLISFIGADALYKTFEDKIFNSLSSINDVIEIERPDKK